MTLTPYFLQAGPIQVRYENGFLRYISINNTEIVRMIYFAIRDHNWQTIAFVVTDETVHQNADSFEINYNWHTTDPSIQMVGQVTIQGDEQGTIKVNFYGKALSSFRKNRIGLCVLHPIEGVLGQPVQVETADGDITNHHFPTVINPHQPFLSIQSMRWRPVSGSTWQLDFSGDVFETEDQRNWTDASFKTYSTPHERPFPVTVAVGEEFRQQVVFRIVDQPLSVASDSVGINEWQQIRNRAKPTLPRVGVGQRTNGPCLTTIEADLLRSLTLSHLRADVFFTLPNWQTLFVNAITDANLLGIPLELAVFFGSDPASELKLLKQFIERQPVSIQSIVLFEAANLTTTNGLLQLLVPTLRQEWAGVAIGGGTDDNFAELNRNPFDFDLIDFVTFSVNPQAHAFDDLTIQENIAGQADTVLSAQYISRGKPVHISPITLLSRYTSVAGSATERLNAPVDHRQATDFVAEWTRQSLSTLASVGVESVTYYQSHGPGGLVNGSSTLPVYTIFQDRAEFLS